MNDLFAPFPPVFWVDKNNNFVEITEVPTVDVTVTCNADLSEEDIMKIFGEDIFVEECKPVNTKLLPGIKKVVFNEPATVVIWDDGTKTIVKCQNGDTYSKETGLAMAIAKKVYGNNGKYNDVLKKWCE